MYGIATLRFIPALLSRNVRQRTMRYRIESSYEDGCHEIKLSLNSQALTHKIDGHHLLGGAVVEVGDADVHEGHVERSEHDEAARQAGLLPPVIQADGRHMKGEMK